jgi:hypothetical protein
MVPLRIYKDFLMFVAMPIEADHLSIRVAAPESQDQAMKAARQQPWPGTGLAVRSS